MKKIYSSGILVLALIISGCNTANVPQNNNNGQLSPVLPNQVNPSPSAVISPRPVPSAISKLKNDEKIAFMSNRSGFWDIYIMNTDGSGVSQLTNDDMKTPFAFSVSPDGTRLAYISDKNGNPDLWVKELESGKSSQITNTELTDEGTPTWSADSQRVLFHSNIGNDENRYRILEVDYPLKTDSQFRVIISEPEQSCLHPSYSPNGAFLLYALNDSEGNSTLYLYDFRNKKKERLTELGDQAINGSWSPDSKKIAFWTNSNGVFITNLNGSEKVPLGTFKNIKGTPFYAPDGLNLIIARGFGFVEDYNVWSIGIDGKNPKQLTKEGGISLGWFKSSGSVSVSPSSSPSPQDPISSPTTSPSGSSGGTINPNDPLVNP